MRTLVRMIAVSFALVALGVSALRAEPIKIGVAAEPYPPFASLDASGKWVGWEIEFVNALCAQAKLDSRLVTIYIGRRGDAVLGYAVIDQHNVRTLPEAFLVVLSPEGRVERLRVLAFHEPQEYKPNDRFLAQFEGRDGDAPLRLRREVHGIAGATLSSQAVTGGVR